MALTSYGFSARRFWAFILSPTAWVMSTGCSGGSGNTLSLSVTTAGSSVATDTADKGASPGEVSVAAVANALVAAALAFSAFLSTVTHSP